MIPTVEWRGEAVYMLDQRLLPGRTKYLTLTKYQDVIKSIANLTVRGAPAIGISAAMGLVVGARSIKVKTRPAWDRHFEEVCGRMEQARPTAVNLVWAVNRMRALVAADAQASPAELIDRMKTLSQQILDDDIAACKAMGRFGAEFVPDQATILTHCNAGSLATGGYGTALGVIRAAHEAGKQVNVLADETRPFLQGARLTAWELHQDNIPVKVVTDNMVGALMARGMVDLVVVGSDRIAINGDVANKIGTYTVAVMAKTHGVPFYVAAPISTVDPDCPSGADIPIEFRTSDEVTIVGRERMAPKGVEAIYQAFDVTPAKYVSAIFTERGVAEKPLGRNLKRLVK